MAKRKTRPGQAPRRPPKARSQRSSSQQAPSAPPRKIAAPARPTSIVIAELITVRDLAEQMNVSPIEVMKTLMTYGIMAPITQTIDFDTAAVVGEEMGVEVKLVRPPEREEPETVDAPRTLRQQLMAADTPREGLQDRPPVVTVLGHVDHGKTTLLDAIRSTNVAGGETGSITQHIGAYQVELGGRKITFLDTPGHEAFTAIRARGAEVTDLAVLVVAADDGVMPQTKEAIDHARAAKVPILVALNKIDRPGANPDRVKQELADLDLVSEDWGGDVICVPVSAKLKQGIEELLENILLVTDVAELKANPDGPAVGTVIEAQLDKARGPVATLLVQSGTLRPGDMVLVGTDYGRVRAMFNHKGDTLGEATPSTPAVILGLSQVPTAGDIFKAMADEKAARAESDRRADEKRETETSAAAPKVMSLEEFFASAQAGKTKQLNIILKTDVQGSIEPIVNSLQELGSEDLKVKLLRQSSGNISESDVMLAVAAGAIIIGFRVDIDPAVQKTADAEGVDVRVYDIIYKLVEDVDKALKGMLEPVYADKVTGHAEIRAVFRLPHKRAVAGCYVRDGVVTRNSLARVSRNSGVIYEGRVNSLKHFKDDVTELKAGFECGIGLEGFADFAEGDVIELYRKERVS
jgi:translation initiation factor IF-2